MLTQVADHGDTVSAVVAPDAATRGAVLGAASACSYEAHVFVEGESRDGPFHVTLIPRRATGAKEGADADSASHHGEPADLAAMFDAALVKQTLRDRLRATTRERREALFARALYPVTPRPPTNPAGAAAGATGAAMSWIDDPLGVAKPWDPPPAAGNPEESHG